MSVGGKLQRSAGDVISAMQFLTRLPMPAVAYREDSLAGAAMYFPLVGTLLGALAAWLHRALAPHLPRTVTALVVVAFLVLVTGALHEDGLADAADGFGGGRTREKILLILRDSRIGAYGAIALCLSLVGRVVLLSALPLDRVGRYLVVAETLCRWTILPLSALLPSARDGDGQGARIARLVSTPSLIAATVLAFGVSAWMLRWQAVAPVIAVVIVAWVSGRYYRKKIGGTTGDCFGATTQMAELAVYLCGVWVL